MSVYLFYCMCIYFIGADPLLVKVCLWRSREVIFKRNQMKADETEITMSRVN